jgi:hypothetical protein
MWKSIMLMVTIRSRSKSGTVFHDPAPDDRNRELRIPEQCGEYEVYAVDRSKKRFWVLLIA